MCRMMGKSVTDEEVSRKESDDVWRQNSMEHLKNEK